MRGLLSLALRGPGATCRAANARAGLEIRGCVWLGSGLACECACAAAVPFVTLRSSVDGNVNEVRCRRDGIVVVSNSGVRGVTVRACGRGECGLVRTSALIPCGPLHSFCPLESERRGPWRCCLLHPPLAQHVLAPVKAHHCWGGAASQVNLAVCGRFSRFLLLFSFSLNCARCRPCPGCCWGCGCGSGGGCEGGVPRTSGSTSKEDEAKGRKETNQLWWSDCE